MPCSVEEAAKKDCFFNGRAVKEGMGGNESAIKEKKTFYSDEQSSDGH